MHLSDIYTVTQVNPYEDAYLAHRHSDHHHVGYRTQSGMCWTHVDEATSRLFEYVVVNNEMFKNFMTFDLDGGQEAAVARALALMENYDVAGWITRTPHGCHLGIMVDPVHTGSYKALNFYDNVWTNLNRVLEGDWGYGRHSTRNPLYGGTTWLSGRVYGLKDLRSALGENWVQDSPFPSKRNRHVRSSSGRRNAHLFTTLVETEETDLRAFAARVNATFAEPLSSVEVASVVKSVARRRRAKSTKKNRANDIFVTWGRKGGSASSERQQESRARALLDVNQRKAAQALQNARTAHAMRQGGASLRSISKTLSVALSTVQRYLATYMQNTFTVDTNPARVLARRLGMRVRKIVTKLVKKQAKLDRPVALGDTASGFAASWRTQVGNHRQGRFRHGALGERTWQLRYLRRWSPLERGGVVSQVRVRIPARRSGGSTVVGVRKPEEG